MVQLQSSTPHLVNLTPDLAAYFETESGVLVVSQPAGASGLKAGDVIEQIAGKPVNNVDDALQMLSVNDGDRADKKLRLQVLRQGKAQTINVDAMLLSSVDSRVIRIAGPKSDIRIELSRTPTGRTDLAP